jgi:hypothetical protein
MTLFDAIRQLLENTLRDMDITSSGGDSPKVNKTKNIDINSADFDRVFESEIKRAVEEYSQQGGSNAGATNTESTESSVTPTDILGLARKGTGGPPDPIQFLTPFMPYLGPLMVATGVAAFLFDWSKSPGGPLDTRYRRELIDEANNFYSRQLQRDTEIGQRQVIIQAQANFRNLGGTGHSNTFKQINNNGNRLANSGLVVTDEAHGLERMQ